MTWNRFLLGRSTRVYDAVLIVGMLSVALLVPLSQPAQPWRHMDFLGQILITLSIVPALVRRSAPWVTLIASCAACVAIEACGFWPVVGTYGPMIALYSLAAYRGLRAGAYGASVLGVIWIYGGIVTRGGSLPATIVQAIVVPVILAVFGLQAFRLAERNIRLAELTEQLHKEQAARAELAVTAERLRIARELHDVVAHHLSVVSIQAGLASYVFDSDPPTAQEALGAVRATSNEALQEMRSVLRLLRGGARPGQAGSGTADSGAEAQGGGRTPGLAQLDALVERVGAAGVDVRLALTGARRPLGEGTEFAVYRIVQEALTNVLKHVGPAATAEVALHFSADCFEARITNTVPSAESGQAQVQVHSVHSGETDHRGAGDGLIGMRERARMLGGTLAAGPRAQGGFEVVFSLPTASAAE
ncbi:signal transduction histidine kinase [Catenulispora sp. EB89]|uniref:sensor histidine kinase n=1 Tax=Catenulispora sp. EB89 TaxID=3156257 RepID=UPI0035195D06